MGVDFEQIKRLPADLRIKALSELIDLLEEELHERKTDLETARELLLAAESEEKLLEQTEVSQLRPTTAPITRETELRKEARAQPVPSRIESRLEEKAAQREEPALERLVRETSRHEELASHISQRPVAELYSKLQSIYEREKDTGIETREDRELVYAISRGLEEKKRDIERGLYAPSAKEKHLMTAAEQMAESMYRSTSGSYQ